MDLMMTMAEIDFPLAAGMAGAVALLLLIFFLILYREEKNLAGCQSQVNLDLMAPKWIAQKAQELERVEAYRLAADLLAHLKQCTEAAELYEKGGNLKRAAEAHLAGGEKSRAARTYLLGHNYQKAARLFMENGELDQAAQALEKAGDLVQAAQVYERGENFERAADIYFEQGLFRRASRTYARAEQWGRAADALWRTHAQERARLPESAPPGDNMPLRVLARRTGELFLKAGRVEEAVEAFQAGAWLIKAAEAFEKAGRPEEAARTYEQAGALLKAADCFEKAGQNRSAARLRAEHHLERGREREALSYLEAAGDHQRAAALHRKFEAWIPAGENYEKAGEHQEAAAMFERAGEFERAAQALEKTGDHLAAARLYERSGNLSAQARALEQGGEFLAAGRNHFERGLLDQAISALQRIEPGSPDYAAGSLLLGQIFREKGLLELALESFKRSIGDQEISRENLENHYQLAVCYERMGSMDQAAAMFEKLLGLDFHFRDAAGRLQAIKAARTVLETPSHPDQAATRSRETPPPIPPAPVGKGERYALLEEIGRGGMGIVYKAQDNILERVVAYKVLPANLKEHPQALKNFLREAKSAARLNHPNIVTVYDAGEESGTYYIAMEFVEGETIKQILNREGKLGHRAILMISGQICKALEYAHDRRIVHRDIKSSNIMWTPEKQVKLMDFGLAKVVEEVKGYQTIASGTPYYMSPEQILGRNIDHRTDIYSLGVTIFEMAAGRLPFIHGDATYHHVHTPPPEAKTVNPDLPPALSDLILHCMQKNPDERFQDAREVFEALRKVLAG